MSLPAIGINSAVVCRYTECIVEPVCLLTCSFGRIVCFIDSHIASHSSNFVSLTYGCELVANKVRNGADGGIGSDWVRLWENREKGVSEFIIKRRENMNQCLVPEYVYSGWGELTIIKWTKEASAPSSERCESNHGCRTISKIGY